MIVSSTDWDQGSISWTIVSANRQKDKMKTTTSSSDRDWRPQIKSFKSFSQTNNIISSWNSCLKFSFYHLVVACNSNFFCSAFEQNTQFDNISVYVCNSPIHISNSHFIPNSCFKFSYYHLVVDCNSNSFCSAFEQNTQFGNIFQFTFQIPIFSFGAEHRTDNSFLIKQKSSSWWVSTSYSSYDSVLHPQLENRRLDQETCDPIFNCVNLYVVMISILLLTWDQENNFCKNHWQWHTQINQSLFPRSHNFSKSIATSSKVPQHILSCKSF